MSNRSPDPVDKQVGQAIRAHRLMARMSQTDLAEQVGVTFQQIQKYERGMNRVGAGRLSRIAGVFDVDVATLFGTQATVPRSSKASAVPIKFISDRHALRLVRAYSEINNRDVRQVLADLIEVIATARPPRERVGKTP
jgi:transcriptional regulator with XRE-family HTH domain